MPWDGPHHSGDEPSDEDPELDDEDDCGDELGRADDPGGSSWPDPAERTWRHPSEVAWATPACERPSEPPTPLTAFRAPGRRARRRWPGALVGTGAVAAAVAGLVLMSTVGTTTGSGPAPTASATDPTTTLLASTVAPAGQAGGVLAGARQALVSLRARGAPGGAGVAVAEGGLVATTADAVSGSTTLEAVGPQGSTGPAQVVAWDQKSDVALVRIPWNLPVPPFAAVSSVHPGSPAMVLNPSSKAPSPSRVPCTVTSVGVAVQGGTAQGMAGIAVVVAGQRGSGTGVLVDAQGQVVGLEDPSALGGATGSQRMFLPISFVLGVAGQLAATGSVHHGWLDIEAADTTTTGRQHRAAVAVTAVSPAGAAARTLEAGDLITAIDASAVRSLAELRSRLYLLPPGTPVLVEIVRAGHNQTVRIELSATP